MNESLSDAFILTWHGVGIWGMSNTLGERELAQTSGLLKIFSIALFALGLDHNLDVLCIKPMNTAQVSRTIELYWAKN